MRMYRYFSAGLLGALIGWLVAEPWQQTLSYSRDFFMIFAASLGLALLLITEQVLYLRRFDLALKAVRWWPLYAALFIGALTIKLLFSAGAEPTSIVDGRREVRYLALDASSSMDGAALAQLKGAVIAYLGVLTEAGSEDLVGCIVFSNNAYELVAPSTNYGAVREALDGIVAHGGTNMAAGLRLAKTKLDEAVVDLPREIVLVSDGAPNNPAGVAAVISSGFDAPVHTVGAGPGYKRDLLREVSERTGGKFFPADDMDRLAAVLKEVASGGLTEAAEGKRNLSFGRRALGWSLLGLCIGLAVVFGKRVQEMLPEGYGFFDVLAIGAGGGLIGGFLGACAFVVVANTFSSGPLARAIGFALLGIILAASLFSAELMFRKLRGVGR